MKKTIIGFISGLFLTVSFFVFIGAAETEEDSLHALLTRLEQFMRDEIGEKGETGRYQLQSFSIDRTHWHYLLDTATGELFRLEPSRTPDNGKWTLMSAANFERP